MAYKVEKINPLDLQSDVAIGVGLPFSATGVFNSTFLTKDAIKTNIINYFLTNKGERYMNPEFGSDIRRLLFDNIDDDKLEQVRELIKRDLKRFFPRVNPLIVQVLAEPDRNTISLQIRYEILDSNIEDELLINIET